LVTASKIPTGRKGARPASRIGRSCPRAAYVVPHAATPESWYIPNLDGLPLVFEAAIADRYRTRMKDDGSVI